MPQTPATMPAKTPVTRQVPRSAAAKRPAAAMGGAASRICGGHGRPAATMRVTAAPNRRVPGAPHMAAMFRGAQSPHMAATFREVKL